MRSLEDYFSENVSEDDHPSTDTSEDSVEVSVTPISRPHHSQLSRLPRKFRKAFEKDVPTGAPLDFSVTSVAKVPERPPRGVSPGCVSSPRSKTNRRKLSEPRRVDQESCGVKRPHEEDWTPRKLHKREGAPSSIRAIHDDLAPQTNILGPNPFLGHFVPPHLLLPPTWGHVARYPYSHLVGSVLGPPLGLLPTTPYPLLPILPPRVPAPCSPNHPLGETSIEEETSVKVNGTLALQSHSSSAPLSESRSSSSKSSCRKFLSVESFLNSVEPKQEPKACHIPPTPHTSSESLEALPSLSDEEVNIQSLLQRHPKQKQRNYKNMTRERRIEANARERTRVHTISAAFETLRRAVPSFSHNQKLSKLSVLRIASSYILSLSRLAGHDYSKTTSSPTFEECVDLTTKTIQVEGKAKKKRDE